MIKKNSIQSHRGRSAIARKVLFSGTGSTNGMIPQNYIFTSSGERVRALYFGGMKKGGSQPSATGFMKPSGSIAATNVSAQADKKNLLFTIATPITILI